MYNHFARNISLFSPTFIRDSQFTKYLSLNTQDNTGRSCNAGNFKVTMPTLWKLTKNTFLLNRSCVNGIIWLSVKHSSRKPDHRHFFIEKTIVKNFFQTLSTMGLFIRHLLCLLVFASLMQESFGWFWGRRRRRRSPPPTLPPTTCHAVDCQVSSWSTWSSCSYDCGYGGRQHRDRWKTAMESCGGGCYYDFGETQSCNIGLCRNGGTPAHGYCRCRAGYEGTCCQNGMELCDDFPLEKVPPIYNFKYININNYFLSIFIRTLKRI